MARLLAITRALVRREEVGFDELVWLDECFRRYAESAHQGVTLEQVLDLWQPGQRHGWWVSVARERRDAALRELHAERFPDLSAAAAARAIITAIDRYQAGPRWRGDRDKQLAEAEWMESPWRQMFIALKSGAPILKRRQLEEVLGAVKMQSTPPVDCIASG